MIQSYLDAETYADADKILADDTRQFTEAIQKAFNVSIPDLLASSFFSDLGPLALLFRRGVEAIKAQQSGVLEEGLLIRKIEERGEVGAKLLEHYIAVGRSRYNAVEHAMALLMSIVAAAWLDIPETVSSNDLWLHGFDDRNRPDPMDFW